MYIRVIFGGLADVSWGLSEDVHRIFRWSIVGLIVVLGVPRFLESCLGSGLVSLQVELCDFTLLTEN